MILHYCCTFSVAALCSILLLPNFTNAQVLAPPDLEQPDDGVELLIDDLSETSIIFAAIPDDEATHLHFQMSGDVDFTDIIIDTSVVKLFPQRRLDIRNLGDRTCKQLYWRARQTNENEESDWSEVRKFTVVHVRTIVLGINAPGSSVMTFVWERAEEADFYQMQLATDDTFNHPIRDSIMPEAIHATVSFFHLKPRKRYYWRVRGLRNGKEGRWSETGTNVMDRYGFFDEAFQVGKNQKSNVNFTISNDGIIGYDPIVREWGMEWPRGSGNIYGHGSGLWFGAIKEFEGEPLQYVVTGFNPPTARSSMTPGRIDDGAALEDNPEGNTRYAGHFASDFNANGGALDTTDRRWPLWRSSEDEYYGAGLYETLPNRRTIQVYAEGPAYLSQEDYFCTYKDTDLNFYEDQNRFPRNPGYPLGVQCELRVYSWNRAPLCDGLIIHHTVINMSSDTLSDCYIGHVVDYDLALENNYKAGTVNDRARFFIENPELELAIQWNGTGQDGGEVGAGFGYAGLALLESPAIDPAGRIRSDQQRFPRSEQLGLAALPTWDRFSDPQNDKDQYTLMSSGQFDAQDFGPSDQRILASCGPFTMYPGDTARLAVAMIFALAASGAEARGTTPDVAELVATARAFREAYDNLPVGVTYPAHSQRRTLTLGPSRPSPANERLVIELVASNAGLASFTVVDLTGAIVRRLSPRFVFPGKHTITLAVEDLAPGAYMIDARLNGARALSPVRIVR